MKHVGKIESLNSSLGALLSPSPYGITGGTGRSQCLTQTLAVEYFDIG